MCNAWWWLKGWNMLWTFNICYVDCVDEKQNNNQYWKLAFQYLAMFSLTLEASVIILNYHKQYNNKLYGMKSGQTVHGKHWSKVNNHYFKFYSTLCCADHVCWITAGITVRLLHLASWLSAFKKEKMHFHLSEFCFLCQDINKMTRPASVMKEFLQ
jgi:hypothetical protein